MYIHLYFLGETIFYDELRNTHNENLSGVSGSSPVGGVTPSAKRVRGHTRCAQGSESETGFIY